MQLDYSPIREGVEKKGKPILRKVLRVLFAIFLFYLTALLLIGLVYIFTIKTVVSSGLSAKADLENAAHQIINRDFAKAAVLLESANGKLKTASEKFDKIPLWRWLPVLRANMLAADRMFEVGLSLTDSGEKLTRLADEITADIRNESLPNAKLSPAHKQRIIKKIVDSKPLFVEVSAQLTAANLAVEKINSPFILPPLKKAAAPLKEYRQSRWLRLSLVLTVPRAIYF
jgi:hypothetical protein